MLQFDRMDELVAENYFSGGERRPWSISELNSELRAVVERNFASVWVEGEITNFHSAASGHWYFSLTDGDAFIKAACFKGQNFRIRFRPENGLLVRIRGRLSIYGPRGELQIIVESLEPVGEGALTVAFEQIKARLLAEGLFDPAIKRPIPYFPRRIGIVTSPTGAAVHDIMTVLERRARSVNIVLIPTLVQGERAGEQIAAAVVMANEYNRDAEASERIDVLIVGRGGGSAEDLWAFNEERVARAIRASDIPVISAVGHETDISISDMAADLRAATPSAAAEIVAKAESEISEILHRSNNSLNRSMNTKILVARNSLQSLAMSRVFVNFPGNIRDKLAHIRQITSRIEAVTLVSFRNSSQSLSTMVSRLSPIGLSAKVSENRRSLALLDQRAKAASAGLTENRHRKLEKVMAKLDALSPLAVLNRGYSITQNDNGEIIMDTEQTRSGEILNIRLAKGRIEAEVRKVS